RVVEKVVPGEQRQLAHRLGRVAVGEVQFRFRRTDADIGGLEDGEIERLLAPVIMVEHPLVDVGAGCDGIDAGAAKAFLGELARCRRQARRACALGIAAGLRGLCRTCGPPRLCGSRPLLFDRATSNRQFLPFSPRLPWRRPYSFTAPPNRMTTAS